MDLMKTLHIIALIALFGLTVYSVTQENWIVAFIAFAAFLFFGWGFLQKVFGVGDTTKPKKTKEELMGIAMRELERLFKITVDRQGSFKLHDDVIIDPVWKFVFARKRDGVINYYFATVDIYTGELGERTGVETTRINEVAYFLHKDNMSRAPENPPWSDAIAQMNKEVLGDLDKKKEKEEEE